MNEIEKVKYLTDHWIEHTEEHVKEFLKWAETVENIEKGNEIANILKKASEKFKEAIEILKKIKNL